MWRGQGRSPCPRPWLRRRDQKSFQILSGNPDSLVLNSYQDGLLVGQKFRGYGQLPSGFLHGMLGIDDQVQEDLFKLIWIGLDRHDPIIVPLFRGDLELAKICHDQFEHSVQDEMDIDFLKVWRGGARKIHQVRQYLADPFDLHGNQRQFLFPFSILLFHFKKLSAS